MLMPEPILKPSLVVNREAEGLLMIHVFSYIENPS
jgi:hypothetical protein